MDQSLRELAALHYRQVNGMMDTIVAQQEKLHTQDLHLLRLSNRIADLERSFRSGESPNIIQKRPAENLEQSIVRNIKKIRREVEASELD